MSHVIIVNQSTGQFYNVDTEGHRLPSTESGDIEGMGALTLLNRMEEGYVEIPRGHIAMRLELNGSQPDDYFEIMDLVYNRSTIVTVDVEVDVQERIRPTACGSGATYPLNTIPQAFTRRIAVIDYARSIVRWLDNPLANDQFTFDFQQASQVRMDTAQDDLMARAVTIMAEGLEPHEHILHFVVKD